MTRTLEITLWDEITESAFHILGELIFVALVAVEIVLARLSDWLDELLLGGP